MPYYNAGDYYQAGGYYQAGDYYQAGGLFSGIGRAIGRIGGAVLRATPLGQAVSIATSLLPTGGGSVPTMSKMGPGRGGRPEPGITGAVHRAVPGGSSGFLPSRRMNVLNIKALRRAMRRAKGFERQARRVGSFFNPGKTFRLKGRKRRAR